ncbi:hypothetical protein F8388_014227 [Cannabis sativa]|uniref:Reverse transcriptase zinc-binding domain-containing protein n=1 Tax=Cannabis sativa TaxID=3483 RepID=A0A7J6FFI8_CANSA|nr:hypothetical protein G4B88_023791 [Cannabis sativa]KAF4385094.1 hypothetical protein F8388_014227 [Cannabis sativa]
MCLAVKGNKLRAKMYYDLLVEEDKVYYARAVWDKLIVPKHKFLFWQIANTQLLTRDFLSQILTIPSTLCPVSFLASPDEVSPTSTTTLDF